MHVFTFTHVRQLVLLITFLCEFFYETFSTEARNSAFFDTHIEYFQKSIFCLY
jgi:hypothetical protein